MVVQSGGSVTNRQTSGEARQSILVVDDNEAGRYTRARALRQAGFDVMESESGRGALDIAAKSLPSLIILDVNLPDIHGFDVCERLKSDPATYTIPVLHMSATSVTVPDQVRGLTGGADAYLVEPAPADVLVATVRALLRVRRAEEALRESHQRFELVAQATRDSIWDYDPVAGAVWWSEEVNPVFGQGSLGARITLEQWSGLIHHEERSRVLDRFDRAMRSTNRTWSDEYRFRRGNGAWADVLSRCLIVRDQAGRAVRVVGAMTDVTAQKLAEKALRASETRLRLAISVAALGTWDYEPNTGELIWDARCKELYGLASDADVDYAKFLEGVHPDDRERAARVFRRALDPRGPGDFQTEFRVVGFGDGRERMIRAIGKAFFEDEHVTRLIGTMQDITNARRGTPGLIEPVPGVRTRPEGAVERQS